MKKRFFFLGLLFFFLGSSLFIRWQQVKASFLGKADIPLISGYAINLQKASFYPLYQILGLTGLLALFLGLVTIIISFLI